MDCNLMRKGKSTSDPISHLQQGILNHLIFSLREASVIVLKNLVWLATFNTIALVNQAGFTAPDLILGSVYHDLVELSRLEGVHVVRDTIWSLLIVYSDAVLDHCVLA